MAVEGINNQNQNQNQTEEMGDGGMQCSEHPYRSNPGGICAFCLQEKLGKLVSSNFPVPLLRSAHSSSSSASSPAAVRSDLSAAKPASVNSGRDVPFLLGVVMSKNNNKVTTVAAATSSSSSSSADHGGVVFKRSKSTAAAVRRGGGWGFWSFLHLYSSSSGKGRERERRPDGGGEAAASVENDEDDVSFERKVSRSRSVGCGSRSFSGDFFERISTGLGDCTLRRVESQREGKTAKNHHHHHHSQSQSHNRHQTHAREERVRCGGIFGGFILTSSSSSSSEWDVNGPKHGPGPLVHNRTRSWGWAFASPIRAFTKPAGPNNGKRDIIRQASDKSASTSATTPNLAAIPSLLAVRG